MEDKKNLDPIGWQAYSEEEMNDEKLAVADLADEDMVGCCDTNFNVITSEEEFQELLAAFQTEGKFGE